MGILSILAKIKRRGVYCHPETLDGGDSVYFSPFISNFDDKKAALSAVVAVAGPRFDMIILHVCLSLYF